MEKDQKSLCSENTKADSDTSEVDLHAGLPYDERVKRGEEIKGEGNALFKENKLSQAIDKYDEAIAMLPLNHPRRSVFLCNRSMCSLKIETPGQALVDANQAIHYDKTNVKAHYRKAIAYYALNKLKEAINALKYITDTLKVKKNKDVNEKMNLLKKMKKERDFLKAIEFQDETDQLDPDSLSIPANYSGPRFDPEGRVSRQWVLDLVEYFKDQKRLHKKYVWMMLKKMTRILDNEQNLNFLEVKDDHVAVDSEEGEEHNLEYKYQQYDSVRYTLPQITVCGDIHGKHPDILFNYYRPVLRSHEHLEYERLPIKIQPIPLQRRLR